MAESASARSVAPARRIQIPGRRQKKALGNSTELPGTTDYAQYVEATGEKVERGDLAIASRILAAQAITLDSMFTEFARRAARNMGQYVDAIERFGRLAMKAQSNCRSTLEALAKLHQPREQTVRHVHFNEGGQLRRRPIPSPHGGYRK